MCTTGSPAMTESQTAAAQAAEPLFNPFAPGFTDDPYPQYATVRAAAPVYEHPFGFWLLTGYADVSWLLRAANLSVEDRNLADSPFVQLREATFGEDAARPVEEMSCWTGIRRTTPGCAGWSRRRSRRGPSRDCGRASPSSSTACWTRPRPGAGSISS